jgi:hypothetical protein
MIFFYSVIVEILFNWWFWNYVSGTCHSCRFTDSIQCSKAPSGQKNVSVGQNISVGDACQE